MNSELVDKAAEIIKDPQLLINIVSRRVAQLSDPSSPNNAPLIETKTHTPASDIALQEIIQGKINYEFIEPKESYEDFLEMKDLHTFDDGLADKTEGLGEADFKGLDDITSDDIFAQDTGLTEETEMKTLSFDDISASLDEQ